MNKEELEDELRETKAYLNSRFIDNMAMREIQMLKDRVFNLEQQLFELTCLCTAATCEKSANTNLPPYPLGKRNEF